MHSGLWIFKFMYYLTSKHKKVQKSKNMDVASALSGHKQIAAMQVSLTVTYYLALIISTLVIHLTRIPQVDFIFISTHGKGKHNMEYS